MEGRRELGFKGSIYLNPFCHKGHKVAETEEEDAFLPALSVLCGENRKYIRGHSRSFAV
jgi:hypothetical protein